MYDVLIIGAGIVGSMIARELSKYDISVCVAEKENDVAMGATKANSAIVHAGFDAKEGTLKAKLNVEGSEMYEKVCKDLGVKYIKNGSLVIGFTEEDQKTVKELLVRGNKNGVKKLRVLNGEELRKLEPNISDEATCALYAPTGAITCPYELTVAAMGNAMDNGVELKTGFEVERITEIGNTFTVFSANDKIETHYIINAAGSFSDEIAQMVGDFSFKIKPRKGEYMLLDRECGTTVSKTVFTTPTKAGKGILVSPTVDGNLILGPTAEETNNKIGKHTTAFGLESVKNSAMKMVKNVRTNMVITSFCGLRAAGDTGDFIINSPKSRFINVAGIESPGLTAAPAIAVYVCEMLRRTELQMQSKKKWNGKRKSMTFFKDADIDKKNSIIKKDPSFGKIVCRCEQVSEGEILEAIRTNPKPHDLDGIKRRTRAQMGRCQGGFCMPHIAELLARENGVKITDITKSGGDSKIVTGVLKGGAIDD